MQQRFHLSWASSRYNASPVSKSRGAGPSTAYADGHCCHVKIVQPNSVKRTDVYPAYPHVGLGILGIAGLVTLIDGLVSFRLVPEDIWPPYLSMGALVAALLALAVPFFAWSARLGLVMLAFAVSALAAHFSSGIEIPTITSTPPAFGLSLPLWCLVFASYRERSLTLSYARLKVASVGLAALGVGLFFLYPHLDYLDQRTITVTGLGTILFALIFLSQAPLKLAVILGGCQLILLANFLAAALETTAVGYYSLYVADTLGLLAKGAMYLFLATAFLSALLMEDRKA